MNTDIPAAEIRAWKKSPEHIPRLVVAPSHQPPREVLRITSMVSTPGVKVRRVMGIKKSKILFVILNQTFNFIRIE